MITCLTLALGVHLMTDHGLQPGHRFHELNPGGYVRCDRNVAGVFANSIGRTSAYVAHLVPITGTVDLSIGAVTGYAKSVMPLMALQFRTGKYRVAFIPTTNTNRGGMHLTTEF